MPLPDQRAIGISDDGGKNSSLVGDVARFYVGLRK
jgi:hypothetical protein